MNIIFFPSYFIFNYINYLKVVSNKSIILKNIFNLGFVIQSLLLFINTKCYNVLFFLGLCVFRANKSSVVNIVTRNSIGFILIDIIFFVINNIIYMLRASRKRKVYPTKASLLNQFASPPYFYRMNLFVLSEFI